MYKNTIIHETITYVIYFYWKLHCYNINSTWALNCTTILLHQTVKYMYICRSTHLALAVQKYYLAVQKYRAPSPQLSLQYNLQPIKEQSKGDHLQMYVGVYMNLAYMFRRYT